MVLNNQTRDKVINIMDETFLLVDKRYQQMLKNNNSISATGS